MVAERPKNFSKEGTNTRHGQPYTAPVTASARRNPDRRLSVTHASLADAAVKLNSVQLVDIRRMRDSIMSFNSAFSEISTTRCNVST